MTNVSTETVATYEMTLGIDLGDRYSHLCLLDREGEVVEEARVPTTLAAMGRKLGQLEPCLVVIEAGTHSRWMSALTESRGHACLVANPYRARRLAEGENKDDKLDAEALARFARSDPRLLKPIQHRGEDAAVDLAVVHSRHALVSARTMLINRIRGLVKSSGARLPACDADSFHRKAAGLIPKPLLPAVEPLLQTIADLTTRISKLEHDLEALIVERYPEAQRLRQVSGVGPLIALTYVLTLERPERFKHSRDTGAYLGLVRRRWQSGEQSRELGISKAGDRYLRWLLIQGAHYILGYRGADCDLRRWGLRHAEGGKSARKRTVVAVARKLAVLLHRLWLTGDAYEPLRHATRKGAA